MMTSFKSILAAIAIVVFSQNAYSQQQISQAQIEQFKKLPPGQQQTLAKSMGIDYKDLQSMLSGKTKLSSDEEKNNTEVFPRGTMFDEDGNPVFPELDEIEKEEEELEKELKPFGYDVFANAPFTFSPTMDIAIPEGYIIGPGDKLSIQVFGKESIDVEMTVTREGELVFPDIGALSVAGLTFVELKQFLNNKIKERIIGVNVVVGIASLRSMRVFVLGDAFKPGPYTLSSLSSITHALFAAGGINDIGSLRNIQLKRSGKLIKTLDLYELLINGDSSNDVLLQSGDVVFIAPAGRTVTVDGEVRRPAIYELADDDSFADVINMAGGFLPSAFAKSTIVERYNQSHLRSIVNVDLTNKTELAKKAQQGDYIRVMKTAEMFEQSVTVIGAVTRPGKYQWQQGQRINDLLADIDSHLLVNADLNYTLVVRETDFSRNIEVLQLSLAKAITNPNSVDNIPLLPSDKVIVFSNVSKISDENITLDTLAFTQEELFKKEKQLAKEKYKTKLFWEKYGEENELYDIDVEAEKAAELVNQSIAHFTGGEVEEEVDAKELSLFSRQRLLMPIIHKLKQQGGAGKPIQLIEIDGQVKYPGVYPLPIGGRVDDLVAAAGGVDESAYLAQADITRNEIGSYGVKKHSLSVNLADALNEDPESNILLSSKDRLNIHKIPAWSENHVVELRGEFKFPGKYTIRRGESLSDLVAKAGGLTDFAHADGSVFSRVKLKELEQKNLLKLANDLQIEMASQTLTDSNSTQSYEEAQMMLSDLTKTQPVGRLVIDLDRIMNVDNYDVLLEDGDVLYVPTMSNSINVIGQVQVTSSHIFDENLTADDYLEQSGGSKKRADESRIYIISANGRIRMKAGANWFSQNSASTLRPGDTIVVPLDAEYMNNLELWTNVTGIIYNSAVAIASISNINK
ncbi:SLBB domain-containing protein [Colwellia sp. D2M02]|uniref:SLBB domain-containing protein n=1 Tax=Colwellia sp. D2M02 TaxID=2841562 RepID=UPI001C09EEBE|nr:SLBB domain-containing protein [Colwellia sp. D2M02]MBU2892160.1 SLBB domain-containing protein [Colwellia sp. D2M02]